MSSETFASDCDNIETCTVDHGNPVSHFLAGTLAGMAGVFVGYPFDTVKVRTQAQKPTSNGTYPYSSAYDCMKKTFRSEGMRGFYKGLSSPLMGDAFTNALVFGVYGTITIYHMKRKRSEDIHSLPLWDVFNAGCGAGFCAGIALTPIELIKSRLQMQTESRGLYSGPIDCMIKSVKSNGITGLFRGLGTTLLRDTPAFGCYFLTYEATRRMMARKWCNGNVDGLSSGWLLFSGGLGGIAAWVVTYPVDVMKSRIQTQPDRHPLKYTGLLDCIRKSYSSSGWRVFYRGIETTMLRAFPVNCVLFFVYSTCIDWLP